MTLAHPRGNVPIHGRLVDVEHPDIESSEILLWTDGHAHSYSPTSRIRVLECQRDDARAERDVAASGDCPRCGAARNKEVPDVCAPCWDQMNQEEALDKIAKAVAEARKAWEADHETNGGSTYFNEMVHLQRKCAALGTDVETYKRLVLENGAARDHVIKEWHQSQDRNAELSGKLTDTLEALKSAQQEGVVVGSRLWRCEGELLKARAEVAQLRAQIAKAKTCVGRPTPC